MEKKEKNNPPDTAGRWKELAELEKVANTTIHDINLVSASKFKKEQYLMLRVLWEVHNPIDINPAKFQLKEWVLKAAQQLENYTCWKDYCTSFSGSKHPLRGTFGLPRFYQKQVDQVPKDAEIECNVATGPPTPVSRRTRSQTGNLAKRIQNLSLETPSKPPRTPRTSPSGLDDSDDDDDDDDEQVSSEGKDRMSTGQRSYVPDGSIDLNFPKTKDEQIVNTALIDFLNALTLFRAFPVRWSLYRKPFVAEFAKASVQARTDGILEEVVTEKIHALVEVKPAVRDGNLYKIAMQEAAQMVAWIKNDPDLQGFGHSCGR